MHRTFGAPRRYVQGPGVLEKLAELLPASASRPLVVADAMVMSLLKEELTRGLGPLAAATRFAAFGGECTADEISRIAQSAGESDIIIGVGGGKAIDTAKGVSLVLGKTIVIVPTVASNDSPTSRLAVLYSAEHVLAEVRLMPNNPDLVLVDTAIIARAPERFFVAGIGDALSKKFEAAQCFAAGGDNFFKARPPFLATTLGDACYESIRLYASEALQALRLQTPNEAFERVVEATILMSGLAFESGGLSIAHAILRGFSTIPELNGSLHGEQVAFGLLVQWVMERRTTAEFDELLGFYSAIGLPRSLARLGYQGDSEKIAGKVASHTCSAAPYVRNMNVMVDAEGLKGALLRADQMGRQHGG